MLKTETISERVDDKIISLDVHGQHIYIITTQIHVVLYYPIVHTVHRYILLSVALDFLIQNVMRKQIII